MMMVKIREYYPYFASFFAGFALGYALFDSQQPKIISLSQHQAQSQKGVQQASTASEITLDDGQSAEIAKNIAKIAEQERKVAQADFSIITDPRNPDKSFDLSKYDSQLPVELNQYNIRAYKKRLRGISYYPESISDWKPAMISVDQSVRISRSGKYLGISAAYNLDNDKAYLGIRYEF